METLYFAVFHRDGNVSLVEQTREERIFTPYDSESQMLNATRARGIDIPLDNIIVDTQERHWAGQLDNLIKQHIKTIKQ